MQIHELCAVELSHRLRRKELSSVEIVQALQARSLAVDGQVRAFCRRFDDQALETARLSDQARARGEALGPLHGVPITIKENVDIAGTPSTMGLRSRQNEPAKSDSVTVQAVREAGAIILGKTNVPQLLLAQEAENSVWGITHNPWDLSRSPGGSSGGEAAALASGQTPLGIGTDIGGSIRIPAHFCGIAGLKPTVDRWSNRGSVGAIPGQELVRAQIGPMARTAQDLALLATALDPLAMSRRDPAVPPFAAPRPEDVDLKGLRVGVCTDDGYLAPGPAIARAVRRAAEALADAGAEIVDYQPPGAQELLYIWLAGISADGGETMRALMADEEVCRQIKPSMRMARLPSAVRQLAAAYMASRGQDRVARLLRALGEKPVQALWTLTTERTALRRAELDAWNTQNLDLVLCPPHALPAMQLGTSGDLSLTLNYPFRYVMLNFPAGVLPITRVGEDEQNWRKPSDMVEKRCAEVEAGSAGLPVGVQVVARPWQEDRVLAAMIAIEARVIGDSAYPRTPIEPMGSSKRL